ncbi:MAG: Wzz/FepE/Etk N-terminal domain-containing protein [Prevotella sp.]|nr:Wzz/FepE/Etk N-terminal domain-containing protein [Prevotella sp.]
MSESIKSQEENIEDNITQAPDQENESTTTTETVDVIKEVSSSDQQAEDKNHEIDIVAIVKKVIKDKWSLLVFFIIFAVLGIAVALMTPRTYSTDVVVAPELSSGSMPEGLSDIASMVGVDLNNGNKSSVDAIYPQIYPDVISSNDFIVQLFNIPVTTEGAKNSKTYFDHITKDAKMGFWDYPKTWMGNIVKKITGKKDTTNLANASTVIDPVHLNKVQSDIRDAIRSQVTCVVDKKTNVITITAKDFDRFVSAEVADTVQKRLRNYIIEYRTKKFKQDVAYAQSLVDTAEAKYVKTRNAYTAFAEANTDVTQESFVTKRDEMENNMQMRYTNYTQALQQLQVAQAKLREHTPVFTVIQEASVPFKPSGTPRSLIVLGYVLAGLFFDAIWVLLLKQKFMRLFRKKA